MLRVLIIDDEAPARRYLRRLLEQFPMVHIEGEASTPDQAQAMIREFRPDVLFLDIELSSGTGFDLLPGLDPAPAVVFVTAHDDYGAQAFDIAAVDYLLKPVSSERLAQTLTRLQSRSSGSTYLTTKTKNGTRIIKIQDLTIAQAQGDYVLLCSAAHANELMHITLKRLVPQLPMPPFCAVSRSMIINLDHIAHVSQRPGEQAEITFTHNNIAPIILGRTASLRLRRAMV